MTRALIMAGGTDQKWTDHGGEGRRHFQYVVGERVIDRIIRQLRERGIEDIGIICPNMQGYVIPGVYRVEPTYPEWGHEGLNGQDWWSEDGRTLMVYGDVIFADRAMDIVAGFTPRQFRMFGRFGNQGAIKRGGGELFAFSFWPEQAEAWRDAVEESFRLKARGLVKRGGSWEGYRYMAGARGRDVGKHRLYRRVFTHIGPPTDDFDTPAQFALLKARFA